VALTGKQRRHLRALGHHLHAVVQVGDSGVTEGVISATSQALEDHELVKIRIADEREGREEAIEALAEGTGAEVAQVLGRTALLFKRRTKKPKIRFDGEVLPVDDEKPARKPLPKRKR
jgi:RNA-binding protein